MEIVPNQGYNIISLVMSGGCQGDLYRPPKRLVASSPPSMGHVTSDVLEVSAGCVRTESRSSMISDLNDLL